jgi:Na+(H+)/acetate symporter ActP
MAADFSKAVALVFAVASWTFCPLLVLRIWWRGLTDLGAIAGVLVGGVLSAGAVAISLAGIADSGWQGCCSTVQRWSACLRRSSS